MTLNMDKQLNNIGLNLVLLLKYARKTQQDLADEMGKSRQAVSAWVNGTQLRSRSLIDLARIMSSWLGNRIIGTTEGCSSKLSDGTKCV